MTWEINSIEKEIAAEKKQIGINKNIEANKSEIDFIFDIALGKPMTTKVVDHTSIDIIVHKSYL